MFKIVLCIIPLVSSSKTCVPHSRRWNPQPLKFRWWDPLVQTDKFDNWQQDCLNAKCIRATGEYGRSNNILKRFVHEVMLATSMPTPRALVLRQDNDGDYQVQTLLKSNFPRAIISLQNWVCVRTPKSCGNNWETFSAQQLYYFHQKIRNSSVPNIQLVDHGHNFTSGLSTPSFDMNTKGEVHSPHAHPWFFGNVIAQIFLNASPTLQKFVDTFDSRHQLSCRGYIAVHIRRLEGTCKHRIESGAIEYGSTTTERGWTYDGVTNFTASDICDCSDRLLNHYNPDRAPIFIMSDSHTLSKSRLNVIRTKYNVYTAPEGTNMWAEALLAIRAKLFIGNPASTLSANIELARLATAQGY